MGAELCMADRTLQDSTANVPGNNVLPRTKVPAPLLVRADEAI
jgi:hypothetical protein